MYIQEKQTDFSSKNKAENSKQKKENRQKSVFW